MRDDPVTTELIRNQLDLAADEMQFVLVHSAYSTIVKEAQDASAALFSVNGETIAQATALPIHLGMLVPAVKRIIEAFPPPAMREGDVYVMNDPYQGGTHIPDIIAVTPIVHDGRAVALACSMAHHQDLGGKTPGSLPTDATEIFQEGLIIPPLKLIDAGRRNETLAALVSSNVRMQDLVFGDLDAQIACGATGVRRFSELVEAHRLRTVLVTIDTLMDRADAMTREHIAAIPDGRYSFTDYLDNDGIDLDRRLEIRVTIDIHGSEFRVDFSGTSPQARGPINAVPSAALSAVYYVVRAITDESIPNNGGCYRCVRVTLPPRSLVNPAFPAPVNARTPTVKRIVGTLIGALAKAMPETVPAAHGASVTVVIGGRDPATGRTYVLNPAGVVGGMGARATKDGISAIDTDVTNVANVPAEALEMDYPVRVLMTRLRRDSAGAGLHRGGLGVDRCVELLRGDATVSIRGEQVTSPVWGLRGGHAAAPCQITIRRADGRVEEVKSKAMTSLRQGDQLRLQSAGGGGYGDPALRDRRAVMDDIVDGKISPEHAAQAYGVHADHRPDGATGRCGR